MKISTLPFGTMLKHGALVAAFGLGAFVSQAQTFVYDGVIYKASGSSLTAQKAGTKVTVGDAGPAAYTGDIKVPSTIEYGGKTYKVTSIGSVFKGADITSIYIGDGVATISRGCFQGDTLLTSVRLPADLAKVNGDLFSGCTSLTEIEIPGASAEWASNQLKGCSSLKKIVFAEGATAIELSKAIFGDAGIPESLEEVVLNRQIGTKYGDVATQAFRGAKGLTTLTVGGSCVSLASSAFESCSSLKNVSLPETLTSLGTNVFAGSGLEEIVLPNSITSVTASLFQGCKSLKKVTLGNAVTSIADMAFYNSTVAEINLPETLKSIGQMAFSGAKLSGALELPASVASVGIQAFANNAGLTEVSFPASTTSLGNGAFMGCTGIAKYSVNAANEALKTDATGAMLTVGDDMLFAFAPASSVTAITGDFTVVAPYAAYKAAGVTEVTLPKCENWGDYAFSGTSIKTLTVAGTVGRYVAANCPALTKLVIDGPEVPFGIAANDAALTEVSLREKLTTVKQDAFLNCTSLKSLNLGTILAILEADCFKGAALETLTVAAANPAGMAQGVFTAENAALTVKVPVDYVDAYKNATGWQLLNIVGDANIAAGPSDMGMPAGLYYAHPDGTLRVAYADGQSDSYDVGGVEHTFQLAEFKNRIYGASAGKKFVYSATGSVDGDGKLFYISKVGGETFQAVVLDNAGGNAYQDPFALYIYGDTLYVNDRNVCIRKIAADAIALPKDYPSWMENNWMGFYGSPWSYGCIKAGWAITSKENDKGDLEPLYWVGMKYNGNGIFRFQQKDIGENGKAAAKPANSEFLTDMNPIFTTFRIDEAHGHMYIYVETAGANEEKITKGGVYRIDLEKLEANPNPSTLAELDAILIDGSPVKYEGSATNEHVGISQFSPDENNEYLYWCYRAPSAEEAATNEAQDYATQKAGKYWWADKYDAENPLHHSGIKRIKLGEANPKVEMVVPGVEGYGVVPVKYEGSTKPETGVTDIVTLPAASTIVYANGELTVTEAAVVTVYNAAGAIVDFATLGAGESLSVAGLEKGVYIATAGNSTVKFVK